MSVLNEWGGNNFHGTMTFSNLANHVRNKFNGMLVFGDVHADYESFKRAYEYAIAHNYFLMSIGDLVDRGSGPYQVVSRMAELAEVGKAGLTIGNHDDKFNRFYKGAKVSFSVDAKNTLANVGAEKQYDFLKMYSTLVERPMFSSMFHTFDDITLVHAASHASMWDSTIKFGSEARSRALYGEVNGKMNERGFPMRFYNWIEDIPMGKTVVVGHDCSPIFNVDITEPMVKTNSKGGRAVFIDTGCGKHGILSGVVVTHDKKHFKIGDFVKFNENAE